MTVPVHQLPKIDENIQGNYFWEFWEGVHNIKWILVLQKIYILLYQQYLSAVFPKSRIQA